MNNDWGVIMDFKKVMKIVKKYKFWVIGVIVLLILILLGIGFSQLLLPNSNKNTYGNRLDGIENYPVENELVEKIKTEVALDEKVKGVKYDRKGRILYFTVDVAKDTDLIVAQGYADKIAGYLTDEQKAFYDIQVFLTCTEDTEGTIYPMIGAKHKTRVGFKWNNYE